MTYNSFVDEVSATRAEGALVVQNGICVASPGKGSFASNFVDFNCRLPAHLMDMISFSFAALRSSIYLVSAWDTFSKSSSARFFSSSLIFLSFSNFSMASFKSRRMLRSAVR